MGNSDKILKIISTLIENGILTSKDIKKFLQILNLEKIDFYINLISYPEEFDILKKIVQKQDLNIKKLQKKKLKGKEILTCNPLSLLFPNCILPPCEFITSSTIANPSQHQICLSFCLRLI